MLRSLKKYLGFLPSLCSPASSPSLPNLQHQPPLVIVHMGTHLSPLNLAQRAAVFLVLQKKIASRIWHVWACHKQIHFYLFAGAHLTSDKTTKCVYTLRIGWGSLAACSALAHFDGLTAGGSGHAAHEVSQTC